MTMLVEVDGVVLWCVTLAALGGRIGRDAERLDAGRIFCDFHDRVLWRTLDWGAEQRRARGRRRVIEQSGAGALQKRKSGRSHCVISSGAGVESEFSGGVEQSGARAGQQGERRRSDWGFR